MKKKKNKGKEKEIKVTLSSLPIYTTAKKNQLFVRTNQFLPNTKKLAESLDTDGVLAYLKINKRFTSSYCPLYLH